MTTVNTPRNEPPRDVQTLTENNNDDNKVIYIAAFTKCFTIKTKKGKKNTTTTTDRPLTFAGSSVSDGSGHVSVKALLAVVAVAAGGVVAAVHADPSALPPRQLVQLHVESTATGVEVAVARCRGKRGKLASAKVSKCISIFTVCILTVS